MFDPTKPLVFTNSKIEPGDWFLFSNTLYKCKSNNESGIKCCNQNGSEPHHLLLNIHCLKVEQPKLYTANDIIRIVWAARYFFHINRFTAFNRLKGQAKQWCKDFLK